MSVLGYFGRFGLFWPFGAVLVVLGYFGRFGQFWSFRAIRAVLSYLGRFWAILAVLGYFVCFGLFWLFLLLFWPFWDRFCALPRSEKRADLTTSKKTQRKDYSCTACDANILMAK